jgi:hypothetical protein
VFFGAGHAYLDLANQANKGVQSVKLHILPPDKRMTTDTTAEEAVIRENLNASAQGFSSSLGNIELLFALQPRKKACEMLFKVWHAQMDALTIFIPPLF